MKISHMTNYPHCVVCGEPWGSHPPNAHGMHDSCERRIAVRKKNWIEQIKEDLDIESCRRIEEKIGEDFTTGRRLKSIKEDLPVKFVSVWRSLWNMIRRKV